MNFQEKYALRSSGIQTYRFKVHIGPSANLLDKLRVSTSCHFDIPSSEE